MSNIYSTNKNKQGFTLVELSIVLIIIGLLIGGILVGQSLIDSARINAQVRQIQQYDIAVRNFRERYKCLPGDCSKFGPSWASPNNNGRISNGDDSFTWEPFIIWYQLYVGKQIANNYSTSTISEPNWTIIPPDKYYPKAKISENAGIIAIYPSTGAGRVFQSNIGNIWVIAGHRSLGNCCDTYLVPSFTPSEALAFDKKTDNGIHYSGNVQAIDADNDIMTATPDTQCTSSSSSGTYKVELTSVGCNIGIRSDALN